MNSKDVDNHLDAVLRASGSALRHFSMQKTLDDMRAAMRAAMRAGATWTPASSPPDVDATVMLALADGEVWQGYRDGALWVEVSGLQLAPGRVTYWMHTPAHPEDHA